MRTETLKKLFEGLKERPRPEDVAALIAKDATSRLIEDPKVTRLLNKVSKAATRSTSMGSVLFKSVGARSFRKSGEYLFPRVEFPSSDTIAEIEAYVREAGASIRRVPGQDYKKDRLSRKDRDAAGIEVNRYGYNKRFRFLCRLEEKVLKMDRTQDVEFLTVLANSRLSSEISKEVFYEDCSTAAYVAYIAARMSKRSLFTCGSQESAHDELSEALFEYLCDHDDDVCWRAVACVDPRPQVITRMNDADKVWLLDLYARAMRRAGKVLGDLASKLQLRRDAMVVKRGDDSSTWNLAAGGWNKARAGWVSVVQAMGADGLFDQYLPGKVMRLMAADVVAWHRGKLDPNTAVWAELPSPWDVVEGKARCDRAMVEKACSKHGLDPAISGWTSGKDKFDPVPFTPTPDSVHGVVVSDPYLAKYLRKLGAFSGKTRKNIPVQVDDLILACGVAATHKGTQEARSGVSSEPVGASRS